MRDVCFFKVEKLKANRKSLDKRGFTFLIPFTLAIVVSITLLIVGAFVVGVISDTLEGTFPTTLTDRTENQNATVDLMGNITEGFSDVVDIEIVVMIIVALSMAIFTVMALGTGRRAF